MRCQLLSPRSCTGTAVRVGVVADTDPHMAFGKGARGHRVPPLCSIMPAWHAVHPFLGSVPPRACGPLPCRECRSPAVQYTVISVAMGRVSLPPSPVECVSTASCLPDPYLSLLGLVPGGCHQASDGGGRHDFLCGRRGRWRLSLSRRWTRDRIVLYRSLSGARDVPAACPVGV